jgi:hypothetical protein
VDRRVQSRSAQEPESMLLIECLSFVSADFLAYPRARRLVFGLGIGERGYLLIPMRFYTRLDNVGVALANRVICGAGLKTVLSIV